jgi:hypothetical protein
MYENSGSGLSAADVAAVTGRGFGGFGGYGDGGIFWILILFLFFAMGNGNWGNNGGGYAPYPYVQAGVQDGFNQQAVMSGINGITTAVSNGFANAEVNECNRAMAMQNNFAQLGLAGVQGFNNVTSGIADLKYTVATENCADRQAVSDGLRDIIANNTANTNAISMAINNGIQSIKDDLCADRIAAKDAQIQALTNQLNMATLAASQTAQTAQLQQYGNQLAQNVVTTCCPKPVPAYVVANPNGCGCNGGFLG